MDYINAIAVLLLVVLSEAEESNFDPNSLVTKSTFHQADQDITLFTLDANGVFRRRTPGYHAGSDNAITYSVLRNGILVPTRGPYPIDYEVNANGDLVPKQTNKCIYKSDKDTLFLRDHSKRLTPVQVVFSGNRILYLFKSSKLVYSHPISRDAQKEKTKALTSVVPDRGCNGHVTLFLLGSDGHFHRNPPDEYLPAGLPVRYHLDTHGALCPIRPPAPISQLTYLTGENGDLVPCSSNKHTLRTVKEGCKSYMLTRGGVLAPVTENLQLNDTVNYFFDGRLIHSSDQFRRAFSNTSCVIFNEKHRETSETQLDSIRPGPRFECSARKLMKRDIATQNLVEPVDRRRGVSKKCAFVYDDRGKRITMEPYINEKGRLAIYKLTCKGLLQRLEPYKEPEYGFEVKFKLLDNFILIPTGRRCNNVYLRFSLQENGNLVPVKNQKYNLKKAPASMVYYVLLRNKELVPVRVNIQKNSQIDVYYQDFSIFTIPSDIAPELQIFTTLYAPLYAYLNSRLTIIYNDPLPNPEITTTWNNNDVSPYYPCRNLYLVGPNKEKIKIEVELNENNVPVIYDMDCSGTCHVSPKDIHKNILLKSYKLVQDGILLPTNDSNGFIYLVDKQGNMLPYCYPESKLRAPHGLTVKYVTCKRGILLPILVEAPNNHVRFSFDSNVIYYKRAYSIEDIVDLCKESELIDDVTFHKEAGQWVYFEKIRKTLYRQPKKNIADRLRGRSAYLKKLPSGTLEISNYPDSSGSCIKIQVDKEGNILIIDTNRLKDIGDNYLLAKNASLIPVDVKKNRGFLEISRKGVLITKIPYKPPFNNTLEKLCLSAPERNPTPICPCPVQVTIPIEEDLPKKQNIVVIDPKKCRQVRKIIKDMVDKDPSLVGGELEMSDTVMDEIYKMVCDCSSQKSPTGTKC